MVAPDVCAAMLGDVGERSMELGELGVEVVELRLGEGGGERGEGPLGLLLPVEGSEADTAQSMHPHCLNW